METIKTNPNKKLSIIAIGVSFLAMSFALIAPDGLNGVNEKPSYISVLDLAEKIKTRASIQLVDLRDSAAFWDFHLPTAEIVSAKNFNPKLDSTSIIVLYSDNSLEVKGVWESFDDETKKKSFILFGGVADWYGRLMYPKIPRQVESEDLELVDRVMGLSKFYGGSIELVEEQGVFDYYRLDVNKSQPSYSHRTGVLRRKGC